MVIVNQFIDLCLLLGCDYLEPIKGVGPKTALKLIREFGNIQSVLEHLKSKYVWQLGQRWKFTSISGWTIRRRSLKKGKKKKGGIQIPEHWPWEEARKIFESPDVLSSDKIEVSVAHVLLHRLRVEQLEWKNPDVEGLVEFLVRDKGFK